MKRIILTSWIALAGLLGAQDMPLSQVLISGEDWRQASFQHEFTDAPTADAKGNFYFSDLRSEQGLYQIIPQGKVVLYLKGMTGISGMKFGPDGKFMRAGQGRGSWFPLIRWLISSPCWRRMCGRMIWW